MPGLPDVTWAELRTLVLAGLGIAVIAYSDNMLNARAFPAPRDEDEPPVEAAEPQQELLGLGGVHLAVGLMSGFPVSSSGSRTALAITARARTQLYSLVAAAFVVLVLFVASPLIENLPQSALAAVVFYAASKLVSWSEIVRLARFRTTELFLAVTAALGTALLGVLVGVGVTIALSLLEIMYRLARPHEGVLGRVPGLAGMHDVDDYPEAETLPGLVVYRYDAPLFFANVGDMRRRAVLAVEQENTAFPEQPVRWLILNVEANVEVDITAADGLRDLHRDLAARGVRLGLARVKRDLQIPLERAGLAELLGEDMLFPTLPVAEEAYLAWALANPEPLRGASGETSTDAESTSWAAFAGHTRSRRHSDASSQRRPTGVSEQLVLRCRVIGNIDRRLEQALALLVGEAPMDHAVGRLGESLRHRRVLVRRTSEIPAMQELVAERDSQ